MSIVRMDVDPLVAKGRAELRARLLERVESGEPLPHLRALGSLAGHAAINSYAGRIRQTQREVAAGIDLGGRELFMVERFHEDEGRMRNRIEELKGTPGLGVLAFRPLGIEYNAGRDEEKKRQAAIVVADTLDALPSSQDVDGQGSTRHFHPATARTSVNLLNHGLQHRGGTAYPEQDTDLSNKNLRLVVIGEGPAVGGPAIDILREEYGQDPVVITHRSNQKYLDKLWQFDGIIGAAGSPLATEMITPDQLERPMAGLWRPSIVVADAAFDRSPTDGTPQGNLHRGFAEYPDALSDRLSVVYTPLGAIGAGTGIEILNATWNVLDVQREELAYAS